MAKSSTALWIATSVILVTLMAGSIMLWSKRGSSDKSSTEIATDPVENLRESAPKHKENITQTANSTSITEAKSTHFHHSRREFCRKCCHTPPCWYKNHKKCSKCANNRQSKIFIKRILQRSHRKAAKHHLRRMAKQL
ncbi:uncharacterized protein LOC111321978 isoform X2 [Stylophora pistillata]|uniref:uncharacterized protein LOC111321978 isoform X2 n=1 Tax=Stylophora pistillata TaxID=50429 RepID=UPI000C03D0EA|nr:uncharacterized protein LOC111321978 isoform X2 [Stylophora pistillata]